jgi:hypothetical protein
MNPIEKKPCFPENCDAVCVGPQWRE